MKIKKKRARNLEKEDAGVREIHHKIEFTREVRKTKMRLGHLLISTPAPVQKGMENEHHQKIRDWGGCL